MRNTASFELFPDAPSERVMARARYLVREGRLVDAERAYREVLAEHPDLQGGWAECFELLRSQGRREDALRLAESARAQFGDSAFALALKGAALIELERYREALATLEQAVEADPALGLGWHELGDPGSGPGASPWGAIRGGAWARSWPWGPPSPSGAPWPTRCGLRSSPAPASTPAPARSSWPSGRNQRTRGGAPSPAPSRSTPVAWCSCSSRRPSRPARAPT